MEEAEALCTKMGIMVKGEFKCFGPATHIKDKFGTGYEIEFKIRTLNEQEVSQMVQALKNGGIPFPLTVANVKTYMEHQGDKELSAEMTFEGIGADFCMQESKGMGFQPEEFVRWYFTESRGNKMLDFIESKF